MRVPFLTRVLFMSALAGGSAAAAPLDAAWWREGKLHAVSLQQSGEAKQGGFGANRLVPLGSLWKLFVYVYAVERAIPTPPYSCKGADKDEVYCCEAGGTVERDQALSQSCGLFFEPARLQLRSAPWRQFWTRQLGSEPAGELAWLADPESLKPARLVSLGSLLRALHSVPAASRASAESTLLHTVLGGRGGDSVRWFGISLRVKTWSWHDADNPQRRLGGAAGWLADGTPLWFAGEGTSSTVFKQWSTRLAAALPPVGEPPDGGCVIVDFFTRYPVRSVEAERDGAAVQTGTVLDGRYRVLFKNGSKLVVRSKGDMVLAEGHKISGRYSMNEYVGRVIDREGSAAQREAARALAVAARTYLQQNAIPAEACQRIADTSARQRVSPNPASGAALAAARWTDQLIVDQPVRYHLDKAAPNTLVWNRAEAQAASGSRFDEILAAAFPQAGLTTLAHASGLQCAPLGAAQAWLEREQPRWERSLRREQGYERPATLPAVCRLAAGAPYSEQSRNRIFVRGLAGSEDRVTLIHEYLHLAFRKHPRGQDEQYVEQLARRLVDHRLEGSE